MQQLLSASVNSAAPRTVEHAVLTGLLRACAQQRQLLQHIQRLLPESLRTACYHARIDEQACLILTVNSPVWAWRLRLQSFALCQQLNAAGYVVRASRIQVLPQHPALNCTATH